MAMVAQQAFNCSDELEPLLLEIQSLDEFKILTDVSKRVLTNIDLLLKLEGGKRMEAFISRLKEKIIINKHNVSVESLQYNIIDKNYAVAEQVHKTPSIAFGLMSCHFGHQN